MRVNRARPLHGWWWLRSTRGHPPRIQSEAIERRIMFAAWIVCVASMLYTCGQVVRAYVHHVRCERGDAVCIQYEPTPRERAWIGIQ